MTARHTPTPRRRSEAPSTGQICVLPLIGFPRHHASALKAILRFVHTQRPGQVVLTGPLATTPDGWNHAAAWLGELADTTATILIVDPPDTSPASPPSLAIPEVSWANGATEIAPGWTLHTATADLPVAPYPGGTALRTARRTRHNAIYGHTRLRGQVTETRTGPDGQPSARYLGLEAGHLSRDADPTQLGFAVLTVRPGREAQARIVPVDKAGHFDYGRHHN